MATQESETSYVLCIDSGGYPESLEVRKVYTVVPDELAAARQYIRVIDETGEDYLYPAKFFVPIEVPPEAARLLPAGPVLLSLAEFESLVSARSRTLDALSNEFDELLAGMQTPKSRKGMKAAFNASPAQLGRASVKGSPKKMQTKAAPGRHTPK